MSTATEVGVEAPAVAAPDAGVGVTQPAFAAAVQFRVPVPVFETVSV
jgi:hypothetical protein